MQLICHRFHGFRDLLPTCDLWIRGYSADTSAVLGEQRFKAVLEGVEFERCELRKSRQCKRSVMIVFH